MGITKIILIANQFCNSVRIFCKSVASFKLSAIVCIYIYYRIYSNNQLYIPSYYFLSHLSYIACYVASLLFIPTPSSDT